MFGSESLIVTAGATHGLHLVATVLLDHMTTVYVEDPTYFIAIRVFTKDFGYNVVPGVKVLFLNSKL